MKYAERAAESKMFKTLPPACEVVFLLLSVVTVMLPKRRVAIALITASTIMIIAAY